MNIIEFYIKYIKSLVIVISGLSGSGKTTVAKKIAKDFNIELIEQFDFYKKDYNETIVLNKDTKIINWDSDDAIDWDKFNSVVNEKKHSGVIIAGMSFPTDLIEFPIDFHIHLHVPKQVTLERRRAYLSRHQDEFPESFSEIDTNLDKLKLNKLTYPYYLESKNKMNITKYINATDINEDQVYDQIFDYLIDSIKNILDNKILNNEIVIEQTDTSDQ